MDESRSPAAVLRRPREVVVEERRRPEPRQGQVLVKVDAVGICGSDVHYYEEGRIGSFVVESPLVLGHESAGTVVELGPGVTRLQLGQRVALEPGVPCRRCPACQAGRYNVCPSVRFFATPPVDGTLQRWVAHDEDFCHPIPDALSDDAGALLEPLSVAIWATWKARVRPGDRVLVTGAGPIGLLCAAVAAAAGAVEVAISDPVQARRERAGDFGVTSILHPADALPDGSAGKGFDVLLECSGVAAAASQGIVALNPAGRAVLVGMAAGAHTELPTQVIQNREIALTGTFRYAGTYPSAIAMAASGKVDLDRLVSVHYRLDQVPEALRAAREDPSVVKPVVLPQLARDRGGEFRQHAPG